ncbi:MAG: hypothetical protein HRT88_01330 [Lentisphaeraceae bacterium]|nr:hypothetical protein [Lentisphaeraceae bacterium]
MKDIIYISAIILLIISGYWMLGESSEKSYKSGKLRGKIEVLRDVIDMDYNKDELLKIYRENRGHEKDSIVGVMKIGIIFKLLIMCLIIVGLIIGPTYLVKDNKNNQAEKPNNEES